MLPLRIKSDLILLFVAMLWGSAFAVQRAVSNQIGVLTFNGLRFMLAGVFLFGFSTIMGGIKAIRRVNKTVKKTHAAEESESTMPGKGNIFFIGLAGVLLFSASYLQQAGLKYTTAANAGFITSLYVILVPILLWVIWREGIPKFTWVGAGLAVFGSLLLSTDSTFGFSIGDLLELAGALFWGLHVILISKVVWQMDLLFFAYGQYFTAGMLSLFLGLWLETPVFYGLSEAWWGVLHTGVLSIAVGYTLQIFAQKYSPATDTAIILSMESVFAAVFGYFLLGEILLIQQIIGCVIILLAIILTALRANKAYELESVKLP